MTAMPVMIAVLCLMAIAYRFYSAFLAAKVATLDETRETPALRFNDGHNYHPTSKWVLFGHHFAAISGAGPLIGPVLAAQFGYLPGLLWIVIGVCLGGAVQDFLVLAASMRRGGKSLAQIAFSDIGKIAGTACSIAILFIIIIALAGLGKVVVKALGGEEVKYPPNSLIVVAAAPLSPSDSEKSSGVFFRLGSVTEPDRSSDGITVVPPGAILRWGAAPGALRRGEGRSMTINESFQLRTKAPLKWSDEVFSVPGSNSPTHLGTIDAQLPPDAVRLVPGSSWGTFTIACTIPIALLVGLWMYKIRPGKVVEASIIGGVLTLAATFFGGVVANSSIAPWFALKDTHVIVAMAIYGFIASVLPVWVLLCPRDYLSSFLKIGTIALLVGGVLIANPTLEAPKINSIFLSGGPTVPGKIFPFLFITIMCGAISGFHALVSSGTTPKMIKNERDARTIGYGAMLIEGLVGVCAMIAAATLPVGDYYAMNTDLGKVPAFQDRFAQIGANVDHLNMYEQYTQESLRGRTGGAVTLAVGMAHIFDGIPRKIGIGSEHTLQKLWKYWYHFAIMFEALFILTTIDTGTRIGRFLLQEIMGKLFGGEWGRTDFWPGAILSTTFIVAGWVFFILNNSMNAIWPMFGVANQMLAVIALAVVSVYLFNSGKAKYLWVTVLPMLFVFTTTTTGAVYQFSGSIDTIRTQLAKPGGMDKLVFANSLVTAALIGAMELCAIIIIIAGGMRILNSTGGRSPEPKDQEFAPVLAGNKE